MADGGIFNKLVSELSLDERQNLLEKLLGQSSLSDEPLYFDESDAAPAVSIEAEYSNLPWYYRLWYFIRSLFTSKAPIKIFEDHRVSVLGAKVEERTAGLYDYQTGMLLPVFYRQIQSLKEAAHFFYSALDTSVNRDRGAFFSFLGSLEMPEVHQKLQTETHPAFLAEKNSGVRDAELRQLAFKAMDDALAMVSEENRNAMYRNARSLNCLKELSSFLYDRLIMAFDFDKSVDGETCSAGVVRELLITLNNILRSLRVIPSMTLLESLFVFALQEKAGDAGFDINKEIRALLIKAENALTVIREFNRQVPLTWILRCSTKDMSLSPREISGGEDWFIVYREYWKRRVESLFADYMKDRRQKDLLNSFRYFLKGKSLRVLENTQSDSNPGGLPLRGAFALSFLYTFYSAVFIPDINLYLRSLLIDGDFQKKEDRIEFAESYNNLIKLEDEIKKFEHDISPMGDYGKRYAQARQDLSSLPVKRRRLQIITEEAAESAARILSQIRGACRNMVNVLGGIFETERRTKQQPKSAGKDDNSASSIMEKIQQFQTVLKILDEIESTEMGR